MNKLYNFLYTNNGTLGIVLYRKSPTLKDHITLDSHIFHGVTMYIMVGVYEHQGNGLFSLGLDKLA